MKAAKILGSIVLVLILFVLGALFYITQTYPKVGPAPDIHVQSTPEQIEHGKYLANHVAVCMDCHSTRQWEFYAGPPKDNTLGIGGDRFDEAFGTVYAKNITPAAIGDWTDGEILRAITSGVDKNGEYISPVMPHELYNQMAEKDLLSIIAYIRTLDSIEKEIPERSIKPPFNLIFRTLPKPYKTISKPDTSNMIAYGEYLATVAGCNFCHTPMEKGKLVTEMTFAGGHEFILPWGIVRTSNITPDEDTGIGAWDEDDFVMRFQGYADPVMHRLPVAQGEFNTLMPWTMYAGMQEQDLRAIYKYLRTVKPVANSVEKFEKK